MAVAPVDVGVSPASTHMLHRVMRAMNSYPSAPWHDALSGGQLESKLHLVSALTSVQREIGNVFVIGGWLGVLSLLLLHDSRVCLDRLISIDIDPSCEAVADEINRRDVADRWRFKAVTADAAAISYDHCAFQTTRHDGTSVSLACRPDTVINTVWEHLDDPAAWFHSIPAGRLVAIQASSNKTYVGHVSPVDRLEDLALAAPVRRLLYCDARVFAGSARFTLIGLK